MFKKSHPLQSKSEIILRNIVVIAMIAFFRLFLLELLLQEAFTNGIL